MSVTRYHGQLSSCTISEKTNDPILRKLSDGRTDGQTDESDFTGRGPTNVERPKIEQLGNTGATHYTDFQLITGQSCHRIEISQLIYTVNQLTGSYRIATLTRDELKHPPVDKTHVLETLDKLNAVLYLF